MSSRQGQPVQSHHLSARQLLFGGVGVLIMLAVIQLFMDRGRQERAPEQSRSEVTHAPLPVIDVMVIADASIAVTNLNGWTPDQVRTYLAALKKARASHALATVGIPTPSTSTGYDRGVVYLIDGHPTFDLLGQFVRQEPPGYALIASAVRGTYRWPPDRLTVGALDEPIHD